MKLNGKTISGPTPEVMVIPKGGEEIVIKAQAVLDYDEFEKLSPAPNPPEIIHKGGEKTYAVNDKKYTEDLMSWAEKKNAWMTITSLKATEGLEWETVKMDDPETWGNYMSELKAVFTENEINMIYDLVLTACGLNQRKIEEATKRFLAGQAQEPSTL